MNKRDKSIETKSITVPDMPINLYWKLKRKMADMKCSSWVEFFEKIVED